MKLSIAISICSSAPTRTPSADISRDTRALVAMAHTIGRFLPGCRQMEQPLGKLARV